MIIDRENCYLSNERRLSHWKSPARVEFNWQETDVEEFLEFKRKNPDKKFIMRYTLSEWGSSGELFFGNLPKYIKNIYEVKLLLGMVY